MQRIKTGNGWFISGWMIRTFLPTGVLLKVWEKGKQPRGVFLKFTDIEKLLLDYLKTNQFITLSKFVRLAGISRTRAENILVKFILLRTIRIILRHKTRYIHSEQTLILFSKNATFVERFILRKHILILMVLFLLGSGQLSIGQAILDTMPSSSVLSEPVSDSLPPTGIKNNGFLPGRFHQEFSLALFSTLFQDMAHRSALMFLLIFPIH